jgi:pimeloyl-ACP methyl ester carboxylesterase
LRAMQKESVPKSQSISPILIGISFGGILATEIAKQLEYTKVILISSAATKYDIPLLFRMAGLLRIHKLIPTGLWMGVNEITYWFFGITNEVEKKLLKQIIQSTDRTFFVWAIDKIVLWKNTTKIRNSVTLHGDTDRILPSKQADYMITGGGHLMIISKAAQVSEILRPILNRNLIEDQIHR